MRLLWISISLLAALSATSASLANWYHDNPWFPVDRRIDPIYNAIGVIETKNIVVTSDGSSGIAHANAWLISPCYAITNNHTVFGDEFPIQPRTNQEREVVSQSHAVIFRVGVGKTLPFAGSVTAFPVRWGRRSWANANDWALLRLSSCLGTRSEIGWLPVDVNLILSDLRPNKTMIKIVFFDVQDSSWDGAEKSPDGYPMYESLGCVYGYNEINRTFRYSVSSRGGVSGAPVIHRGEDGVEKVIGVHRGGHRESGHLSNTEFKTYIGDISGGLDNSNEFINIRDIINSQDIKEILTNDFLAYGKAEPWRRSDTVRPPIIRQGAKPCASKEPN